MTGDDRSDERDGLSMVRQIGDLLRTRPRYGDDDATRAAWFEQKAAVFDAIAARDRFLAVEAAEAAESARLEARRLRGGGES